MADVVDTVESDAEEFSNLLLLLLSSSPTLDVDDLFVWETFVFPDLLLLLSVGCVEFVTVFDVAVLVDGAVVVVVVVEFVEVNAAVTTVVEVVVVVVCVCGELDRFEFDEFVVDVVDVAAAVVELAARSRPPVFCCCSRCNLN